MNTESVNLDPLRQKPDFEAKANQIVFYRWDTENDPDGTKANNFVEDYIEGCEHVWNTHVEPLMNVNEYQAEKWKELESRIRELEEDRDKFAIGFAELVRINQFIPRTPSDIYELIELYKESLNQKP